jgi:hypothetical protein
MTIEENEQDRSNDLEQEIETDPPAGEEEAGSMEGDDKELESEPSSSQQDEEEEEIEVSLGEESDETESGLITDLRQRHRKLKQKYRKTQYELDQLKTPQTEIVDEPGPKPTLEACDYDSDEYDKKISAWFDKKHRAEAAQKEAAARAEKEKVESQRVYRNYEERKNSLKVKDFSESEDAVTDALSITQQNIILCAAKKPELIVYALGKSPAKMEELSKLNDIQFAMELARLEDNLKVGKRKPKTKPEKTVNGTGTLSGTTDRTLERLREEAAKTGDMSKVMQYRRKKRRAAAG